MPRVKKRMAACLCCLVLFQLCRTQNINCTTDQDADQTTYRISPESCVSGNASDCEYTWTNGTNHVIAHDMAKSEQVLINDINKLVTTKCLGVMILSRSCISEKKHYQAVCLISCSEFAEQHQEGLPSWIPIIVVIVAAAVLGLVGLFCFLYRDKIGRLFSGDHAPVPNPAGVVV